MVDEELKRIVKRCVTREKQKHNRDNRIFPMFYRSAKTLKAKTFAFAPACTVSRHIQARREFQDFGYPSPVFFLFKLNIKIHALNYTTAGFCGQVPYMTVQER